MYPVYVNNQQVEQDQTGLNGWFGRMLKKALRLVASAVKSQTLGVLDFTKEVDSIGTAPGASTFWQKGADYEPTPLEEATILNWIENKIAPFIGNLSKDLLSGLEQQNLSTQLAAINLAMRRICFLKQYYQTNDTKGLSALAVTSRTDFLNKAVLPIENVIANAIKNKNFTTVSQNSQFTNLEVGSLGVMSYPAYPCLQYQMSKFSSDATQPITTGEINNAIATTTGQASTTDKSNSTKWFIGIGALLVVIALFSGSKKKKN